VAHFGPELSLQLGDLAEILASKYIHDPAEPFVNVYASLFGARRAQADLKFNLTYSRFHLHAGFAEGANYLLPSTQSPVVWLGYFWDEANDLFVVLGGLGASGALGDGWTLDLRL